MPLHVSSTSAHHREVKIALHSLWYHHTYRCDDTRGCVMKFWPPDDEHMCSKHVEAWNKLIVKQKFCASSWLISEISELRWWSAKRQNLKLCSNLSIEIDYFHFSVQKYVYINGQLIALFIIFFNISHIVIHI